MKAKELRELLQTVDDDAEVVIPQSGYSSAYGYETATVTISKLADGEEGCFYHPEHLVFPPIDLVPVVIIQ